MSPEGGHGWAAVLAIGSALSQPSSVGIALIDRDGTLRYVSAEGVRLIESDARTPPGTNAFEWLHPDDLEQGWRAFREVLEQPGRAVTLRARAATPAGSYRWVDAVITNLLEDPDVGAVVVNSREITDWKWLERELVERTALLQLLLEQLPAKLWTTDRDLRVTPAVGAAYAAMPGDPRGVLGKTVMEVSGEQLDPGPVVTAHLRALAGEPATYTTEWRGTTWRSHVEPLRDPEGRISGTVGVALDVTESTLAAEQLERSIRALQKIGQERRELIARLASAQEDERVRVAREIHDDIGQLLTSASLLAKSVEEAAAGTELRKSLGSVCALLEKAQVSARSIVARIRVVDLGEEGLSAAVAQMAAEVWQRHAIDMRADLIELDDRLTPEAQTVVYRIVQEAVTNAFRHASPKVIRVVGSVQLGRAEIRIEDDGCGFSAVELMNGPVADRFGILGMQERAAAVGGDLQVESRPGVGTTVTARLPLATG